MTPIQRTLALREGGQTQRCHTMQYIGPYNIAIHSYNALVLLFALYPGQPRSELVKAILFHDTPERWTGDIPTPAKLSSPELKDILNTLEQRILEVLGIERIFKDLTMEEEHWLQAVDLLELFVWGQEQSQMGNKTVDEMNIQIRKIFKGKEAKVPFEVLDFIEKFEWFRSLECHEVLNA